jgi:hypothetical protein
MCSVRNGDGDDDGDDDGDMLLVLFTRTSILCLCACAVCVLHSLHLNVARESPSRTRNPKPEHETRNPKPCPEPETRNPKPSTLETDMELVKDFDGVLGRTRVFSEYVLQPTAEYYSRFTLHQLGPLFFGKPENRNPKPHT